MSVVAVTGATGFIGRHVVQQLLDEGTAVRAVVRGAIPPDPALQVRRIADLADAAALTDAFRGCSAVVHLAGLAHVAYRDATARRDEFRRVNVAGTRAVAEAAVAAGLERMVLLSSAGSVATFSAAVLAHDAPRSPDTPYGRSKAEAEDEASAVAAAGALGLTILRPPLVYGAGMKGNPLRLWNAVWQGWPVPVPAVGNRRSVLYVGNLAVAIAALLARPRAVAGAYFLTDEEPVSTAEFVALIARTLGRSARVLPVPQALLAGVARIGDVLALPVNSDAAKRLTGSLVLDGSAFQRAAAFRPPFSTAQGVQLTSDWFRTAKAAA